MTTPLHNAAARGHTAEIARLIAAGADLGARDPSGQTPLEVARRAGNAEVIQALEDDSDSPSM